MNTSHPPFFIVGSPRSGTTLLQRIFEANPDVCFAHESYFLHHCEHYLQKKAFWFSKNSSHGFGSYYLRLNRFTDLGLDSRQLEKVRSLSSSDWPTLWVKILSLLQEQKGKKRMGEKSPHHVLYIDEILKIFPKAKIILMIRDPRAVVPSMIKAGFGPRTIHQAAMQWITLTASGLTYRRHYPESVYLLHYETLIQHTSETLKALCDFLELPFDENMLKHHTLPTNDAPYTKVLHKQGVTREIYSTSLKSWKKNLEPNEIQAIEIRCGLFMRCLGYKMIQKNGRLLFCSYFWIYFLGLWKALRWLLSNNSLSRQSYRSQALGFWITLFSRTDKR